MFKLELEVLQQHSLVIMLLPEFLFCSSQAKFIGQHL